MPARPWGQRIGSNDKHNEWKLFIGQVPLEVSAKVLGNILSCLHAPKSPGCAWCPPAHALCPMARAC